jgi:hypothetical protein
VMFLVYMLAAASANRVHDAPMVVSRFSCKTHMLGGLREPCG